MRPGIYYRCGFYTTIIGPARAGFFGPGRPTSGAHFGGVDGGSPELSQGAKILPRGCTCSSPRKTEPLGKSHARPRMFQSLAASFGVRPILHRARYIEVPAILWLVRVVGSEASEPRKHDIKPRSSGNKASPSKPSCPVVAVRIVIVHIQT